MKFITVAFTMIPALAAAKVLIAVTTPAHTIGDTYDVEWLVDTKMVSTLPMSFGLLTQQTLELWLVRQTDFGWEKEKTIFQGVESKPCNGSFKWVIDPSNPIGPYATLAIHWLLLTLRRGYALWLNGQDIPDASTGYASMTDWFEIKAEDSELR